MKYLVPAAFAVSAVCGMALVPAEVANAQMNAGKLTAARNKFEHLLKKSPTNYRVRFQLALLTHMEKRKEEARKWESAYAYAKRVHDKYLENQNLLTISDREQNRMQELPTDFDIIAAEVFIGFLVTGQVQPLVAQRLWASSPDDIKVRAYDRLAVFMSQNGWPKDVFDQFFPEPAGLAAWRAQLRLREEQDEKNKGGGVFIERDS